MNPIWERASAPILKFISQHPESAITLGLQTDKSAGDYARLAVMAEGLGFDGISVFHDLGYQPSLFPLLEMARVTSLLRLGAACLNPSLLHPIEIAGQVAALDLASEGRAYLGLARGSWLDRVGSASTSSLARLAEAAEVIRLLIAGDGSGFDGQVFSLQPGTRLLYPRQREKVDLLIGTWGQKGLALAGAVADEVKLGGCANPDMVRAVRKQLDQACNRAGRPSGSVGLVIGAVTVVDNDPLAARRRAAFEVAPYLDVVAPLDITFQVPDEVMDPLRSALQAGDQESAGRLIPGEILDRFAISGDPTTVANHAMSLFEAGASRVEFGTPHGRSDDEGIDLLGRQVLPLLRQP